METQFKELEKNFTSYSSYKRLTSGIQKKLKKLNTQRTNNPTDKWANAADHS
jgi:hypothetical protein